MNRAVPALILTVGVGATAVLPAADAQTATTAALRRVAGTKIRDRFGDNLVVIYLQGRKIKDIHYTLPTDRARSARINAQAGPLLRQEALRAQKAQIHVVSGATYTSDAFAQSLQAAINRAHI
jgi:uncharacterized protein with FMN-binding domain